jgi:outer membrane lipoprotein SlyB
MRFAFIPWIALSVVSVASGEPIETITRDTSLSARAQAQSLHSLTGAITMQRNARVTGDVETGNGEIVLEAGSQVTGKLSNTIGRGTPPRVVIGPRATVAGALRFKREVKLLVSESATIGPVVGATPVMFATEQPPN